MTGVHSPGVDPVRGVGRCVDRRVDRIEVLGLKSPPRRLPRLPMSVAKEDDARAMLLVMRHEHHTTRLVTK